MTDSLSVQAATEKLGADLRGKLDIILNNNAGFMTPASAVPEANEGRWWRTFEVNLKGPGMEELLFRKDKTVKSDSLKVGLVLD